MNLYDTNGDEISVSGLKEDIVIDLAVNSSKLRKEYHSHNPNDAESLAYHTYDARSNHSSVHLILRPGIKERLDVFVKFGGKPAIDDFDINMTVPHDIPSAENLSIALRDELSHTLFISPETIQMHGGGIFYVGVRKNCKFVLNCICFY